MSTFSAYVHRNDVLRAYAHGKCTASPTEVVRGFLQDCAARGIDEKTAAVHVAYMLDKMTQLVQMAMAEEHRMQQEQRADEYDRANFRTANASSSDDFQNAVEEGLGTPSQPQAENKAAPTPESEKNNRFATHSVKIPAAAPAIEAANQQPVKKKTPAALPRVAVLSSYSANLPVTAAPMHSSLAAAKSPAASRRLVQSARQVVPTAAESRRHVLRDLGKKNVPSTKQSRILSPKPEPGPKMLIGLDRELRENNLQLIGTGSSPTGQLDFDTSFSPPPARGHGRWTSLQGGVSASSTRLSQDLGACFTRSQSTAVSNFGYKASRAYLSNRGEDPAAQTLSSLTRDSSAASSSASSVV